MEDSQSILPALKYDVLPDSFVLTSISKKRLSMLLELVRVLEKGMFAFIIGKEYLDLILTEKTWRKIEFDFDEGRTCKKLHLIAIKSKINWKKPNITFLLAKLLKDDIGTIITVFEDQYLLVDENNLEKILTNLKSLSN